MVIHEDDKKHSRSSVGSRERTPGPMMSSASDAVARGRPDEGGKGSHRTDGIVLDAAGWGCASPLSHSLCTFLSAPVYKDACTRRVCADRVLTSPYKLPSLPSSKPPPITFHNSLSSYNMFHYSPSPRSLDYTSYLPPRSYRPASFDLYDAPSSAFSLEDLGYSSSPHSFLPPRTDAETRYRRALYELEAAEQEYEAHVALERARQVAAVRQRAAADAARIKREDALYAEIERARRARSLQAFGQRQRGLRAQTGFDRVHHGDRGLLDALVLDDDEGVSIPPAFEGRRCRSQPIPPPTHHDHLNRAHRDGRALLRALVNDDAEGVTPPRFFESRPSQATRSSTHRDNGIATLEDLLGLFGDVRGSPEPEAARQSQKPSSPAASQPSRPTESQTQPHSAKHEDGEVNLSDILNFFHGIAAQVRGAAGGEQSAHEVRLCFGGFAYSCLICVAQRGTSSQPEAAHADGKGKGKAKAQPVPEPTLYDLHERVNGARDQELRDLEFAIKLSLQDRDTGDVKKAEASKASRSSPGASSSNVSSLLVI